jgi:arginase family enzyme
LFSTLFDTSFDLNKQISTLEPILFLVGYASDMGASNCDSRTGAEKGPECVREIMKKMHLKISHPLKFKLVDCGDVSNLGDLESLTSLLTSQYTHSVILVIGGTDELNLGVLRGINDAVHYIKVDSSLDVKEAFKKEEYKDGPVIVNDLHHLSYFRMMMED